jgi:hypothetical protein
VPERGLFLVWRNPRNAITEKPEETEVRSPVVDVERNVFEVRFDRGGEIRIRIPLDDVESVWESSSARWLVRLSGHMEMNRVDYISNPARHQWR